MHHQSGFLPEPATKVQKLFLFRYQTMKKMCKNAELPAKRLGNWRNLCNFAGMEQNLPDIIRGTKALQKGLLNQGGFMKFVVEHINEDGLTLFAQYQEQIVADYRKANMWDPDVQLLSGDELRLKALGPDNHLKPEFRRRKALEQLLVDLSDDAVLPDDAADTLRGFYDGYMGYAWREYFEHRNPEHATDLGFYKIFMEQFRSPYGLAYLCMKLTLKEHHGLGWTEEDQYDYYRIAEYHYFYLDGARPLGRQAFDRFRRGVNKWLEGKTDEECLELAKDMLKQVRFFSQHIYNDEIFCGTNGKQFPLEDKQWLRQMVWSLDGELSDLQNCLADFVLILSEVGRIWAARLLKIHGIDLHQLEKLNASSLRPYNAKNDGFDYYYYVDHYYTEDNHNTCFVHDSTDAKALLYNLYHMKPGDVKVEHPKKAKMTNDVIDVKGRENNRRKCTRQKNIPSTIPQPALNLTLKYLKYNEPIILKLQEERLRLLYSKWKFTLIKNDGSWGWLGDEVDSDKFHQLFTGKIKPCNLKFAKGDHILMQFFLWLLVYETKTDYNRKELLIEKQTNQSAKRLLREQFGIESSPATSRLTDGDIKRIKESIYILDYHNSLPLKPGGGDNDYDETDDAIQQLSNNIDLGIGERADVEQAVMSGELHAGKHT